MICEICVESHPDSHYRCKACWRERGPKCIVCDKNPARSERIYKSRCKPCLADRDSAAAVLLFREESEAYLQRTSVSQSWNGSEPGLQALHLPLSLPESLPAYSPCPTYLSPKHCRLCLQECDADALKASGQSDPVPEVTAPGDTDDVDACKGDEDLKPWNEPQSGESNDDDSAADCNEAPTANTSGKRPHHGVPKEVVQHIRCAHNLSPEDYRTSVLRRGLAEWPDPVSPQVLRTCLAAFKNNLNDEHFLMGVCASCAREKRRIKLRRVEFPPPDATDCPPWLPWSPTEWQQHREDWYKQLHEMLGTEAYLQKYFHADERVAAAVAELERACSEGDGSGGEVDLPSEPQARAWLHRVESWRTYARAELFADGVPAPGNPEVRWLLYLPTMQKESQSKSSHESISCDLCTKCREAFASLRGKTRAPKARMPRFARANGLWRGPEPPELAALSYAETKVIQRARLYVSIKRIFLNAHSYARTSRDEAPRCHERNVVAYPQNPDAVYKEVGLMPENLCATLLVQFVGGDHSRLRYEPTLTVDIARLRAAFSWLVLHN